MKHKFYFQKENRTNGKTEYETLKKFNREKDAIAYYSDDKNVSAGVFRLATNDKDDNWYEYDERRNAWIPIET